MPNVDTKAAVVEEVDGAEAEVAAASKVADDGLMKRMAANVAENVEAAKVKKDKVIKAIGEFLGKITRAIRTGQSDPRVLGRLLYDGMLSKALVCYTRDETGTFILVDGAPVVKDWEFGYEVYLTLQEIYSGTTEHFNAKADKDSFAEIDATMKLASKYAGQKWGANGLPWTAKQPKSTAFKLDPKADTIEEDAGTIFEQYNDNEAFPQLLNALIEKHIECVSDDMLVLLGVEFEKRSNATS